MYCTSRNNKKIVAPRDESCNDANNSASTNVKEQESHSIIKQYAEKNELEILNRCLLPSPECLKYGETPEIALDEIVSCIEALAEYKTMNALVAILNAGASGCIQGFVPRYKVWFLQPEGSGFTLNWFLKKSNIPQGKQKRTMVSTSNIPPQTSSLSHGFPFEDYEDDDKKNIQLNVCRALLPNLARSSILEALLNTSEKYEDGSGSLKLFATRSLHRSIDAVWYSWGKAMYMRQFVVYFIWLLCVTALAIMKRINGESRSTQAIRIALIVSVAIGLIYFVCLEAMQIIHRGGFSQYVNLSWNLQQVVGKVCIFQFIIVEISRPSHDATIVATALSQLLGWINLLYYVRGISEEAAWIIYALPVSLEV